jgi:type VI secretion system secreted protein VgrG
MQLDPQIHTLNAVLTGDRPLPRVHYEFSCEATPGLAWQVRRVALDECLSWTYEVIVDLLVAEGEIDPGALLAASCELSVDREGVGRTVCGVVARVELHDRFEDQQPIRVFVVPALQLLEQRVDMRLWQGMTAVAVVEEVLTTALGDYDRQLDTHHLTESYPNREYIVQYDESDLDFVSRLLEDEGIAYHFDHERGTGREVLVLEDTADHWTEIPTLDDNPALHVIASREDQAEVESIQRLTWERAVRPTAVVRRIFDWLAPTKPITALSGDPEATGPTRELYHHGRIVEPAPEPRVVREFAHARAGSRVLRGVSNVTGLAPGHRFRVAPLDRPELEHDEFLVTRVLTRGDCPDVQLGESGGGEEFVNEFECVVLDGAPWRPPLRTPNPKIHGPQTALVTGPEGEEIHTDEHGRIKVRFDWDREHALTDDTSMWIRVAHGWAGSGFGMLFIPRVGMEVVVEFIGGDPDRPLVTGCVYNGESPSSVALPDSKTQSTIRTRSSPGGDGFNELRFEDAAGAEVIYVHAQRDCREKIGRNSTSNIGSDRKQTVGGDHRQTVHGNQTLTVDGTRTETVRDDEEVVHEKARTTTIYGEEIIEVFDHTTAIHRSSLERRIYGTEVTQVFAPEAGVARSRTQVEGDLEYQIKDNAKLTAGDRIELIQGSPDARAQAVMANGNIELSTEQELRSTSQAKTVVTAETCLELKGGILSELRQGKASIRMQHDCIHFEATEVRITVGSNEFILSESGLRCQTQMVEMAAEGPVTITGSTVDID